MPCLITTRFAIKKITRQKKQHPKKAKTKTSRHSSYLILKARSNNVKLQSDKTLTTQIYFFLTKQQKEFLLN